MKQPWVYMCSPSRSPLPGSHLLKKKFLALDFLSSFSDELEYWWARISMSQLTDLDCTDEDRMGEPMPNLNSWARASWNCDYYICRTKGRHLPSTSRRSKSLAAAIADLQHILKGIQWRSGMRHSVFWEKLAEQTFRLLDISRRRFYESNFLISSYLEKH